MSFKKSIQQLPGGGYYEYIGEPGKTVGIGTYPQWYDVNDGYIADVVKHAYHDRPDITGNFSQMQLGAYVAQQVIDRYKAGLTDALPIPEAAQQLLEYLDADDVDSETIINRYVEQLRSAV